jgi:hypothetical protein
MRFGRVSENYRHIGRVLYDWYRCGGVRYTSAIRLVSISMAGLGNNPVQVLSTLPDLQWEFLRLWTGFELPSSCPVLPAYAPNLIRNSFCVMR